MANAARPSSPESDHRRSSVHVHRSNTSRRPFLSIDPVEFSLTDGTAIPAPKKLDTPPESPSSSNKENLITRAKPPGLTSLSTHVSPTANGPLSSHPVTPIEVPNGSEKGFPFNRHGSNSFGSNRMNGQSVQAAPTNGISTPARATTPNTPSPLSQHQHNGLQQPDHMMSPPGSEEYHDQSALQDKQNPLGRSRRPSFAERFLRFRSISSLRGRNASNTSFAQTQHVHNDGSQYADGPPTSNGGYAHGSLDSRGVKRPGSPSIAGIFRASEQAGNDENLDPGQRGSQSFPRMVRKKSMELLGTARRKSGMWSGRDTMNAMMAEEYQRERMREQDADGRTEVDSMNPRKDSSVDVDGRQSKMSTARRESLKEPPPMLPELSELREMEGESMFANIGKDI